MAESNDPAELIGRVVADKYRVVSLLGLGSMGAVYDAERVGETTHVALKVLRPELTNNDDVVARFQREAKTLGLLRHRNIVELLEVGRLDDGTLFFATELVRGVSLRALIDDGHVEPKRALAIMGQVLDALGHAHAVGVVHRDVKPENIMLVDGGTPGEDADLIKMLDFGVAKLLADTLAVLGDQKLTQTGITLLGTPMYMPPETVLGKAIDARGDLYSVGVIVFELMTGHPPFTAASPAALMELHAGKPAPTLASAAPDHSFTPQLEHLVAESLAKKPERRFASAAEMKAALDAAVHSLELPPDEPARSPERGPKRSDAGERDTILGLVSATPARGVPQAPAPPIADFRAAYPAPPPRAPRVDRRRQLAIGGGVLALALIVIIAIKAGGSRSATSSDLAKRAADRLSVSDPIGAVELVERELASPGVQASADVYLVLGHARFAVGRRLDALAAYERAIALDGARASDAQIRTNATKVLDGNDMAAAIVALDLLAHRIDPPAKEAIVAQASTGKLADVRHRAFALAEQLGIDAGIDRIESWSMDLRQAPSCDERRTAVIRLRAIGDRRALPALRRARAQYPCIDHDLSDAIGFLEAQR